MEIRLIGGRAEGRTMVVPDNSTQHTAMHEDGTIEVYSTHFSFVAENSSSGGQVGKVACFALRSMSLDEVLARARELFDDPDED